MFETTYKLCKNAKLRDPPWLDLSKPKLKWVTQQGGGNPPKGGKVPKDFQATLLTQVTTPRVKLR